jgi:hypothetical protein
VKGTPKSGDENCTSGRGGRRIAAFGAGARSLGSAKLAAYADTCRRALGPVTRTATRYVALDIGLG